MKGTRKVQTRAMDFTPPMMTNAVRMQMRSPTNDVDAPKVSWASSAMELACTVHPMPKLASAVKTAKSSANHFIPSPCSRTYMGPP